MFSYWTFLRDYNSFTLSLSLSLSLVVHVEKTLAASKLLTDGGGIISHMKKLSIMVERAKEIVFRNEFVMEIEKQGDHCLVEKVQMD